MGSYIKNRVKELILEGKAFYEIEGVIGGILQPRELVDLYYEVKNEVNREPKNTFNPEQQLVIETAKQFAVDLTPYISPLDSMEKIQGTLSKLIQINKEIIALGSKDLGCYGARSLADFNKLTTILKKKIISGEAKNTREELIEVLNALYPHKNVEIVDVVVDETEDAPPKLILDNHKYLLNFRNYYWTTSGDTMNGSNPNQVNVKDTVKFSGPKELVIYILRGINVEKVDFSDGELELIEKWIYETKNYYGVSKNYFKQ